MHAVHGNNTQNLPVRAGTGHIQEKHAKHSKRKPHHKAKPKGM